MSGPGGMDRARILVVEDSVTQALQIRQLLEQQGFDVDWSSTAESALESLNGQVPDLVIADYHLPGMNGDGLSRQIRLNARTSAIPVLMLTEAAERETERQGLESGADAYLAKSADRDVLLLRIRALLRRGAARPDEDGEAAGGATEPAGFRRPRILVVDGSATARIRLGHVLSQEGYAVSAVGDDVQAVAAIEKEGEAFDCVMVNIVSPAFDGLALCRRLDALRRETSAAYAARLDAAGPNAARRSFIIVCLGTERRIGGDVLGDAFDAGADDLIPTSADTEVLSLRVRNLIRRKLLQDENRRAAIEAQRRQAEIARARAEAAAAEALTTANRELAAANAKLRDTQSKLVQAAKMASLGELVAGIAHEINNPLAFLLAHQGTVERLLGRMADQVDAETGGAAMRKCLDRVTAMRVGLQRIQDLVLNLRKFSRLDEGEFQTIDVPEAIDTVLALLAPKFGDRIAVHRHYAAAPELYCAPGLFNQVVMNILGNAADAIAGEGAITISTQMDEESYTIAIDDTGPGIPPELRDRIFEPFFTTKPVGSGTGLGLSIAYSVVEAHRGTLSVGAGPGGGASFTIAVPRRGR